MTTTTAHKRLDEIETFLTPKEWAIRLADEGRKYPSALACTKAMAKLPLDELPVRRPYFAFEVQAGDRYPGNNSENIRARHRLTSALWNEFHTLKLLIRRVNLAMQRKVETIALEAALRFSALHALVLQDAFAQTARQIAALLTTQRQRDGKSQRQAILKLLTAFTDVEICETPSSLVPPEDALCRYPAPLVEWKHELVTLLKDFFAHRAAVELVQERHFDGHPILFLDLDAELTETVRTIESAVATANDYLKRRADRDSAESNAGACESNPAIALESIKANSKGQRATAIAEKWMNDASFEAIESDAEQWERWREEYDVE